VLFLHIVPFLAMLTEAESHDFIVRWDAQSDYRIHDFQNQVGPDCGNQPRDQYSGSLLEDLMPVAFNPSDRKRPAL